MVTLATAVLALDAALRILTLHDALETARTHQPQLRQARASTQAATAAADQARAPLLPQITATAEYDRATANVIFRPGTSAQSAAAAAGSNSNTYNFYSSGVVATQLIYDFGQTSQRWRSQKATAAATEKLETVTLQDLELNVRATFFTARANKALVTVAEETVANLRQHLDQTEAFVKAGTRPDIDLYQARSDLAGAEVDLVNARNNYAQSRAQLNQVMGVEGSIDFDVADESLAPMPGEDASTAALVAEAVKGRPELASLADQQRAQELNLSSVRGQYGPSIAAVALVEQGGDSFDNLNWNAQVGVRLTWNLFQGGFTKASVRQARAQVRNLAAQDDFVRQQIRLEVEQVRLAVAAAKASQTAAREALNNAKVRLQLAEGRYRTGVGNIIEWSDAQVALTAAATRVVSADLQLATARAQLLHSLGRRSN